MVNAEWVKEGLLSDGYTEVRVDDDLVVGRHSKRPNASLRVNSSLGIITMTQFWKSKKGWGREKALDEAIVQANLKSWMSTYCKDNDADLMVSSFLFITESLTQTDLARFLDAQSDEFMRIAIVSGLMNCIE